MARFVDSLGVFFLTSVAAVSAVSCGGDDDDGGGAGGLAAAGGAGPASGAAGSAGQEEVCPEDVEPATIAPDDPNLQYSGRFDFSDPSRPVASASGVTVSAKFRGGAVKVMLEDQFLWNSSTNVNQGYYDVIVDDREPVKISPVRGTTVYDVPVDLDCGEHTVTLMKRTEASIGNFTFLGFEVGEILTPDPATDRRILVIGDSITCGSGTDAQDGTPECTSDDSTGYWAQPYESAYLGWGSVLARAVDAERHIICAGGIGLVRNYTDRWDARTMPDVYDLMFIESNQADTTPNWDPSLYVPDAILIALGTNDFSPGEGGESDPRESLPVADFVAAYADFIDRLKGYYPGVHVFLVSSPMLGDEWPTSADHFRTDQLDAHDQLVAQYADADDVTVEAITVSKIYPSNGCGGHPDAEQQATMTTDEIEPAFRAAMGW